MQDIPSSDVAWSFATFPPFPFDECRAPERDLSDRDYEIAKERSKSLEKRPAGGMGFQKNGFGPQPDDF